MGRRLCCLGLMSGTSLDGVDAAILVTDGEGVAEPGLALTLSYPETLRSRLRSILNWSGNDRGGIAEVERDVTLFHVDVAKTLLGRLPADHAAVELVGFHGHTILHRPKEHRTWQIGDGGLLAQQLGIPVVNDFRSADVAAGGQGAPLAPVYHRALTGAVVRPVAVLNLGGVGNITWIGEGDQVLAFDTGPANALIDDWVLAHTGQLHDEGGALAASGGARRDLVKTFLTHPYFDARPPKSLDRDDFRVHASRLVEGLPVADGAATLTAFTVAAIAAARAHLPAWPLRWLVTGGGRHNRHLMAGLAGALNVPVEPIEAIGADGDALEAQAFAYMAVRSLNGLPITFPGTTGIAQPLGGGVLHPAAKS